VGPSRRAWIAAERDGRSQALHRIERGDELLADEACEAGSRDGSTGTATFRFQNPDVLSFNDVWENGLITGLWMKDDEGLLMTRDLDVAFERGSPTAMTAILVLKSTAEWDRFMRFMQRYAESNSLEFERAGAAESF
jgi:photosystem II protein